ncbi:RNA-guided endonuclease TnpB family protein [Streptomyces sp. DH18]|uniref:RNA-guided endonuclease InsQ/TnpB family protein n=1 Tax=unclassified Streptomyces TaxID=2593676 RepID=UPI002442DBA3|nr:RNA-guided endonuclease TnpB family protein [Streptomyces sp. DH18]MDG9686899.1 RNA-guided endonuclease TnpB family protein [Streptomyces sp. DH18]
MELRYTFRLEPGPGARASLARAFGCARVVWNDALTVRRAAFAAGLPFPRTAELSKSLITQAKRTTQRAWLADVSSVPLQQALRDQDRAWRAFFDSLKGSRKGAKVGAPAVKSRKDSRQSVRFTSNAGWKITPAGKLSLPKIGHIPVRWSRQLPCTPSSVTVIRDGAGRYFASFVVRSDAQADAARFPTAAGDQGIDLGLAHFAVLADGSRSRSPRFLRRAEKKVKKRHRTLSRKQKGSNNREKARVRLARAHAGVADARKDFHHQLSTKLVRENQSVTVETLNVQGLSRGALSKAVHDAGWGQFLRMLEYKAKRYGREFTRVAPDFPSSQLCSACGHRDGPKPLNVRTWTCPRCGALHDRDWNAGQNLREEGRRIRAKALQTAPPTPGPGALTPA